MPESVFQGEPNHARAGTFVGGPTQASSGASRPLCTGEAKEAAIAERVLRRRGRTRSVTKYALVGTAFLTAVIIGTAIGEHEPGESEESLDEIQVVQKMIDSRIARVMAELWAMEEVEASRGRGRF